VAAITPIRPISRNAGIQVPSLVSAAEWVDCLVLTAGTAKSYSLPVDTDGNKGTILGISATAGPLYINADTTAAVPSIDITDGTSPSILRTDDGFSYLVAVADSGETLSFLCPSNCHVHIEVWK